MTRIPFIAGNWKMNLTVAEAREFAKEVAGKVPAATSVESAICAPATHLEALVELTKDSELSIGAENCHFEQSGAYTGETSPYVLNALGVKYVILGHSERREYFGETDELINKKTKAEFANGLVPIVCCGETLEQYEAGQAVDVITAQLQADLAGLTKEQAEKLVVAYEPIWAIGTGKTATSDQAEEMLAYIRSIVAEKYGKDAASETSILYGGSCKASNAPELFSKPNIDGGLIGGASLKAADFKGIIDAWKK